MTSMYLSEPWESRLVNNVLIPAKELLGLLAQHQFRFRDLPKVIRLIRELGKLPEPTRENTEDANSRILIDMRDDFTRRMKLPVSYQNMFRLLWKFVIIKNSYDRLYKGMLNWFIGEAIR